MDSGGAAVEGGSVDADWSASLLPGLELFIPSLLLSDDSFQGVCHSLELLLVCVTQVVHTQGKCLLHHMIAAGVPGCGLVYHGDKFSQEGELFVLSCGNHRGGCGRISGVRGLLVFLWWCDVD